jgi:hypothetical protein
MTTSLHQAVIETAGLAPLRFAELRHVFESDRVTERDEEVVVRLVAGRAASASACECA